MQTIYTYIKSVLTPHLRNSKASNVQVDIIASDVSQRLKCFSSLKSHETALKVMSEIHLEVTQHYQPSKASLESRTIAAICVRNSVLEDFHADTAYNPVLQQRGKSSINDKAMKKLIQATIRFFDNNPLPSSHGTFEAFDFQSKHPCAFAALSALSSIEGGVCVYMSIKSDPSEIMNKHEFKGSSNQTGTVTLSGIDPRIDPQLQHIITSIVKDKNEPFFIPSFKLLTRNVNKLMDVLEILLASGGTIVSLNYVLTNGKVLKRSRFLKTPHNVDDISMALRSNDGLNPEHKEYLDTIRAMGS